MHFDQIEYHPFLWATTQGTKHVYYMYVLPGLHISCFSHLQLMHGGATLEIALHTTRTFVLLPRVHSVANIGMNGSFLNIGSFLTRAKLFNLEQKKIDILC